MYCLCITLFFHFFFMDSPNLAFVYCISSCFASLFSCDSLNSSVIFSAVLIIEFIFGWVLSWLKIIDYYYYYYYYYYYTRNIIHVVLSINQRQNLSLKVSQNVFVSEIKPSPTSVSSSGCALLQEWRRPQLAAAVFMRVRRLHRLGPGDTVFGSGPGWAGFVCYRWSVT